MQKVKRVINNVDKFIVDEVEKEFLSEVPEVKSIILNGYDGLSDMVTDVESKSNPLILRSEFENKLDDFVYIKRTDNSNIQFITPDLLNFDFSGIELIKQILEGTSGQYVEVSYDDMIKLTGKTTINDVPIDKNLPKQKRVYLIRYTNAVRTKEKSILKKKLIRFPFSNTHALDANVFGPAEEYVDHNIDMWTNDSIKRSTTIISQKYRRV